MHDTQGTYRQSASASDWFNYASRYVGCNHQIHCLLQFERHLDEGLLRQAARSLVEAEPVLGCRFVEDFRGPYWEQRDDLDEIEFCAVEETRHVERSLHAYVNRPVDSYRDPQLQMRIFRTPSEDLLCIKMTMPAATPAG
ncbi:hypothetical protein GTO89_04675 [Heliobacterium gestii]|uniref:Uncharacterized protein n=1 Tax=Heliomicrobium gestii TaxID=2699 RepID=A0A845LCY4_HELGE|nr:hypothetical protein [Heliomicrobium gestii]MBM7866908.1 NRPS condensation-like uncharacterized protein [Heliomicrobium gestii]MZP42335.1 hypothetical protein [Heliomicrobium gestii]